MKKYNNHSLQELFKVYINESRFSACLRLDTIKGYENVFHLFLKVMPEVSTTRELTEEILLEFFKRIQTRQRVVGKEIKIGVKNSTIKTQWSKLDAFFKWLEKKGHIENNPLGKIKPPKVDYDDFKRLKDEEINRIYSAITLYPSNSFILRRDTLMVSILLYCGLRKGEFISLLVSDIDPVKNQITVRGETSKSRKNRTLPMHPTLILHLKEYLSARRELHFKTEKLIASSKKDVGLSREGLKHWVNGIIKKSGIKFHLHQFRHTFACKLAEEDVNLVKIQKMLGHVDITMTQKYTRSIQTEDLKGDIDKISF